MARTNGSHHPLTSELLVAAEIVPGESSDHWPNSGARVREREIATISHELRNSLAVVRGASRLLQGASGAEHVEAARVLIERHASHMARHIEELDHGRPDGGSMTARFARTDLRKYAGYAIDAVASDFRRRAHRLSVTLPPQPVWVYGDGDRLEQAIANILTNAGKYTPDGGSISLTMEHADGWVSVAIRDSGIGMTSALLPRVFDMYVQGDAAATGHGQGIGLSVVRDLVIQHGGNVKATSAGLGLGSELTVRLPTL